MLSRAQVYIYVAFSVAHAAAEEAGSVRQTELGPGEFIYFPLFPGPYSLLHGDKLVEFHCC